MLERRQTVDSLAAWADGHERSCNDFRTDMKFRVTRIEAVMLMVLATVVIGGATVLWQLIQLVGHIH